MDAQKQFDDCCSDDDIFLSPAKRKHKVVLSIENTAVPVQGIYEERVRRMKSCLVGIPRPPVESCSVNFNMEDVETFLNSSKSKSAEIEFTEKINSSLAEKNKLGIYLNVDHSCEELERLGALYIEKYIPCETLSTMSNHSSYNQLTASAKKRRRCNGWATSPGSRLSYLARRKSTFSVDQVSKMGQPVSSKQFLLQRDNTIKRTKSVPLKPKRALFQSPDEEKSNNPFRTPDINDEKRRRFRRLSVQSPIHSTRLQQNLKENRKQRSCRKSLEFVGGDLEATENRPTNESSDKHVKRKLLWAVSTALKSVSVTSSHSKFKICMNKLFKAALTVWCAKQKERKTHQENSSSTSEAMLVVTKSLLGTVILPELGQSNSSRLDSLELDSGIHPIDASLKLDEVASIAKDPDSIVTSIGVVDCENGRVDEVIPLRTLSELTNSESSAISLDKIGEEPDTNQLNVKDTVRSTETILTSCLPLSNNETNASFVLTKTKEEFRYSNHKRKREEALEEEELLCNRSEIDCYQIAKSAKTTFRYRTGLNKLTSSGT